MSNNQAIKTAVKTLQITVYFLFVSFLIDAFNSSKEKITKFARFVIIYLIHVVRVLQFVIRVLQLKRTNSEQTGTVSSF